MDNDNHNKDVNGDEAERKRRQAKIGQKLRQLYDDVANEPVPDDFLKLLEQADQRRKTPEGSTE